MDNEDYEFTIRTQFKQLMELCDKISYLEYKNDELKEENKRLNNIINHIEEICKSSIASVDKHLLDDKIPKVKDGKILNYNDYQIIRLKAFRTKSKEILGRIKELKGIDKEK